MKVTDEQVVALIKASHANLVKEAKKAERKGAKEANPSFRKNGPIDFVEYAEQKVAEQERMRKEMKKAPETALPEDESSFKGTVVSDADRTKVLKNLDNLQKEYENKSVKGSKTFIGDLAKALRLRNNGNNSNYGDYIAVNGVEVTIRVSDHNISVSGMDAAGKSNGISIVIGRKANKGVRDYGDAHIVEFYYNDKRLRSADGNPFAEIINAFRQTIYSGEYKDTTGLAEVEEVNNPLFRKTPSQEELDAIRAEEAEIERKAKADGTWMKAPNGKPSNLSPRQWVQVRTKAFKKWFGDWELFFKKNFLLNGEPVASLTGNEFAPIQGKTLTSQVGEHFESIGGKAVSPLFGDVVLDRDGADDSFAHGVGRIKAIAYGAVKDVIEQGILIDYHVNHKDRGYGTAVIVAPINIKGERYFCYVTITRKDSTNRFYLHEVWTEKNLTNVGSNTAQRQPSRLQGTAKILQNIVFASDDVSKIVDENGEPLVVYHSGASGIREFSHEYDKTGIGRQFWGSGFYFGTEKSKDEWARRYEGKTGKQAEIYQVFLNLRNPKNGALSKSDINNYDGAILPSIKTHEGETEPIYIATSPTQIKSATDNVGTFDGEEGDIRFRKQRMAETKDLVEYAKMDVERRDEEVRFSKRTLEEANDNFNAELKEGSRGTQPIDLVEYALEQENKNEGEVRMRKTVVDVDKAEARRAYEATAGNVPDKTERKTGKTAHHTRKNTQNSQKPVDLQQIKFASPRKKGNFAPDFQKQHNV